MTAIVRTRTPVRVEWHAKSGPRDAPTSGGLDDHPTEVIDMAQATRRIRTLRDGETPPETEPRRYKNANGYVRLRWFTGSELVEVYEHRFVAGARRGQQVHHINGVRDDNRPENLQVVTPSEHSRHHNDKKRIDVERAKALYASGMSTPEVGRALGCNHATVYRALVRAGVQPRSRSDAQRRNYDVALILALKSAGKSNREIARIIGCSHGVIGRRLRELTP